MELCRPTDPPLSLRGAVVLLCHDANVLSFRYAAAHERFKDLEGQLREARSGS